MALSYTPRTDLFRFGRHLLLLFIFSSLMAYQIVLIDAQPHNSAASDSNTSHHKRPHHNQGHRGHHNPHQNKHHDSTAHVVDVQQRDKDIDYDASDLLPRPGTYIPSNCSTCIHRDELRKRNLEVIKDEILSKLGMQTAPNMTGRHPPRIPPLEHLFDMYGMQGDAPQKEFQPGPVYDDEEDDFHARTEKVIAFAQSCKSH